MIPKKKNLPRPTVEQLNEFDQLRARLDDLQGAAYIEVVKKRNDLYFSYDWDNYEFTDPATGKKGVKNAAGQILVPAEYDGFTFLGDHNAYNFFHLGAEKDGKFGVVSTDGSGKVLCDFRFDDLDRNYSTGLYTACWDGVKDRFGFVSKEGKVLIPNVLTKLHKPWNDFMLLEADGKFGAFDVSTYYYVLPEYDQIDWEPDKYVVFHKDGVEGYVIEETGEFVPKEKFEGDEKYNDAYVYNTNTYKYLNDFGPDPW